MTYTLLQPVRTRHLRPLIVFGLLLLLTVGAAVAPRPVQEVLVMAGVGLLLVSIVVTAVLGLAITAVVPPLIPMSEVSILGKRVTAFAKFALAVGALFGTAVFGWMVAVSYESTVDNPGNFSTVTGQLIEVLSVPVLMAAIIYWVWLAVDLLRLRKRRRANAIDLLVRLGRRHLEVSSFGAEARHVAKFLLGDWWWVFYAYCMAPVALWVIIQVAVDLALF